MKSLLILVCFLALLPWAAAKESVARVRESVPTATGAEGQVEIEVFREAGGYTVERRSRAVGNAPAPPLPPVAIKALWQSGLPSEKGNDGAPSPTSLIPGEQQGEERLFFPISAAKDTALLQAHLVYSLPDPEGGQLLEKSLPLRISAPAITLRREIAETALKLLTEQASWPTVTLDKPGDADCLLRLKLEVPVPFGTAPLQIEVFCTEEGHLTLVTTDLSEDGCAPYTIPKIIARPQGEETELDLTSPANTVYSSRPGIGQFTLSMPPANSCFIAPQRVTLHFTLADEWELELATLPIDLPLCPPLHPQSPVPAPQAAPAAAVRPGCWGHTELPTEPVQPTAPLPHLANCVSSMLVDVPLAEGQLGKLRASIYRQEDGFVILTEDLTPGGKAPFFISDISFGQSIMANGGCIRIIGPSYNQHFETLQSSRRGIGCFTISDAVLFSYHPDSIAVLFSFLVCDAEGRKLTSFSAKVDMPPPPAAKATSLDQTPTEVKQDIVRVFSDGAPWEPALTAPPSPRPAASLR